MDEAYCPLAVSGVGRDDLVRADGVVKIYKIPGRMSTLVRYHHVSNFNLRGPVTVRVR